MMVADFNKKMILLPQMILLAFLPRNGFTDAENAESTMQNNKIIVLFDYSREFLI